MKTKIIFLIIIVVISSLLPIYVKANTTTINVILKRDETDLNKINIIATDSEYNITELKYVHKYIEISDITYFEENNDDVHTFSITPAKRIQEEFRLEGYGSYTIYVKNSNGNKFLSRITLQDPTELPNLTVTKDAENPLHITLNATSNNNKIQILKIAKKENFDDIIDFSKDGTNISFVSSNEVNVKYTNITEEGIYVIYVEDTKGNTITRQLYLGEQNTPIKTNISSGELNRQVNIEITDTFSNIVKVKVAKASEINDFNPEDFKIKGEELNFTQGKLVNITYIAPENDTYIFYIEDEAGYKKMIQTRILGEEKAMQVTISQLDNKNKGDLTIYATNNICNIVKMKVAVGNNIDIDYFKNNGEEVSITQGKNVTAKYMVTQNCILNVYVEDEQGYSYMLTKNILGVDNYEPPKITISSNTYEIDNENKLVLKISPKTIKKDFDELLTTNHAYTIIKKDGSELLPNEIIGTGMKLELLEDMNYTLVVTGDISGDGTVTVTDLLKAKQHFVGLENLEEIYEKAGDTDFNGKITVTDILQIKRNIVGLIEDFN